MLNYDIKIKSFSIEGFRLFNKTKVAFDENNHIVFLGKNGSGKTSFLEALNICLSENSSKFNTIKEDDFYSNSTPIKLEVEFTRPFFLSLQDGGFNRLLPCKKFSKIIKRRSSKAAGQVFSSPYVIEYDFEFVEFNKTQSEYQKTRNYYKDLVPDKSFVVKSLKKSQSNSEEYLYTIESSDQEKSFFVRELIGLEKVLYPRVFYFDKNRSRELLSQYNTVFSNITQELDWRFRREVSKNGNGDGLFEKYSAIHSEIHSYSAHKDELFAPAMEILQDAFKIDFPIGSLNFFFFDLNEPFKGSIFGHKTSDILVDINKSGSGVSILVALALLVAFSKQSKSPIVTLIDEPEMHLHSDLQKNLSLFLRTADFQSFVSSHSHQFAQKENFSGNFVFRLSSSREPSITSCDQIALSNALFDLLGNSLDDLYIPENLVLVEGTYDKAILSKCLSLLDAKELSFLILDCGGYTEIPPKGTAIENFFQKHLNKDNWYSRFIKSQFRVVVDGDVDKAKVDGWIEKFEIDVSLVKHLQADCIEYLYPESVLKMLVEGKVLKDGTLFVEKSGTEIVQIILEDEKVRSRRNGENQVKQNLSEVISKQRMTEFVVDMLTEDILKSSGGNSLREIAEWIIGNNKK